MAFEKGMNYNSPNGDLSSIDKGGKSEQVVTQHFLKRSLIEAKKKQFFIPLASTVEMPKHMGQTIKTYLYVPLLDDRNKNDQGIDASGAKIANGNLYGSSKDIGTITDKLPTIEENGGRVNRVGFTRLIREGSIYELGLFYEYSEDALVFDSDAQLKTHLARELLNGATELVEDILQCDLIAAAGVNNFSGAAAALDEVTAEGALPDILSLPALSRLDQTLAANYCPKDTTIISGSRLVDTKVVGSCRIAFIGSELVPLLYQLEDNFGGPAFIPVEHYAASVDKLNGEVGTARGFRFIEVPEMVHHAGKGATVGANPGYRETGGKYDVFPLLVVGDDSFSTITFQSQGQKVNFRIITKDPGPDRASRDDPYGKVGFSSIRFHYGFLCKRPERIAVLWTVAPI